MTASRPSDTARRTREPDASETVSGFDAEYRAIRESFGVSDVSGQGKLRLAGEAARDVLDVVLAGNVQNLPENAMRSTLALDPDGGIRAEVLVYAGFDEYVLLTEAGSIAALIDAITPYCPLDVEIRDLTESHGLFRVDGPDAADLPRVLIGLEAAGLGLMGFTECRLDGIPLTVGRIGSTGEWGYQFMTERANVRTVLDRLLAIHPEAVFCGRGVFDVLHLEVRSFNVRRDRPRGEPPLAAGLHWMFDFRKPDFIGRDAIIASKQALPRRMVCVRLDHGAPVPPVGADVAVDGKAQGYVANAALSPTLGVPIALGYLETAVAVVGLPVTVDIGGRAWRGETVSAPFFRTRSNRLRERKTGD